VRPVVSRSYLLISQQQKQWAARHRIGFNGSSRVVDIDANLFRPLHPDSYADFTAGDGGELMGKIKALHSSAALVCNTFDYWRTRPDVIGKCLGFSSKANELSFEKKLMLFDSVIPDYSSDPRRKRPNADVYMSDHDLQWQLAIEAKFTEPYVKYPKRPGVKAFTSTYFRSEVEELWSGMQGTRIVAERIQGGWNAFKMLDPTQLITTALACRANFGASGWKLVFLWYEVNENGEATDDSKQLAEEIAQFTAFIGNEVPFESLTWQALFRCLEENTSAEDSEYLAYLQGRYFGDASSLTA
jgi:hypothetical protein